jgi:AbrB family looped-hinge helix DNA binding protein
MPPRRYVLLSSKGQIVIPADIRRQLGLQTGQRLSVRANGERRLLLEPIENGESNLDADLARARTWVSRMQRDLVDELHRRRARERARADVESQHGDRRH